MTAATLNVNGIRKTYRTGETDTEVLRGVSFAATAGETVAILGPSGSGKSTLLYIIGSLDTPTEGSVHLGDTEVTALSGNRLAEFRSRDVGFVFQDHHLLPQLTALENVILPTLALNAAENATDRARALLETTGVAHRANAFPANISGGERQRVAIARAMINSPRLLLCDEPSGNLDRDTASSIISLFLQLASDDGVIVLMATHNHEHAQRFSHSMMLKDGRLVESASDSGAGNRGNGGTS